MVSVSMSDDSVTPRTRSWSLVTRVSVTSRKDEPQLNVNRKSSAACHLPWSSVPPNHWKGPKWPSARNIVSLPSGQYCLFQSEFEMLQVSPQTPQRFRNKSNKSSLCLTRFSLLDPPFIQRDDCPDNNKEGYQNCS